MSISHGAIFGGALAVLGTSGVALDLTPDWQVFVVEFTAVGNVPLNDARLRIWLAPYDNIGTEFEFDMVTLVPKSVVAGPTAAVSATPLNSDLAAALGSGFSTLDGSGRGRRASGPGPQVVPADIVLSQGDFIDGDEAGRLAGGYVPENGEATCESARPSRGILLPPNGQMARINIVGLGSVNNVSIYEIWQDGPPGTVENATFDGGSAWLRKAQNEGDTGRVYTIKFTAEYGDGEVCEGSVVVTVPEDRKTEAVFSGQWFDATSIFVD